MMAAISSPPRVANSTSEFTAPFVILLIVPVNVLRALVFIGISLLDYPTQDKKLDQRSQLSDGMRIPIKSMHANKSYAERLLPLLVLTLAATTTIAQSAPSPAPTHAPSPNEQALVQ